jgi:hypothetical protein
MTEHAGAARLLLASAAGAAGATALLWLAHRARRPGDDAAQPPLQRALRALQRSHAQRLHRRCADACATATLPGGGEGVLGAIGNTPLVRLASLSAATGCEARTTAQRMLVAFAFLRVLTRLRRRSTPKRSSPTRAAA